MPPSAPLLSDSIQLVRDSRSRRPPGGDPQPWGPASTAGGHPGSSLALSTRWLLEAGVAHSWGPSHTPRPWGQASRGCQTPRGTRALGALGPRTTSLSPPGIRWDGISANPASAEGRAAGKDQDGGEAPRGQLDPTPRPQRSGGWWGGGCEGQRQGQPPAARSSALPACHRARPKRSVGLCSKIEKELQYPHNCVERCGKRRGINEPA